MKEELYEWMRNLAVYYIFLTAVMNFIPDEKYARYIRYFTGMLLILLLCGPILSLFKLDGSFLTNLKEQRWRAEEYLKNQEAEVGQEAYLHQAYEKEAAFQVGEWLKEKGLAVISVEVELAEDTLAFTGIQITLKEALQEDRREEIAGELEERYQIRREAVSFFSSENGKESMVRGAAFGDSAGGDRPSGKGRAR